MPVTGFRVIHILPVSFSGRLRDRLTIDFESRMKAMASAILGGIASGCPQRNMQLLVFPADIAVRVGVRLKADEDLRRNRSGSQLSEHTIVNIFRTFKQLQLMHTATLHTVT